ncbi:hypothetical protein FOBRF1_007426 [Fusarium oxysporum]
MRNSTSSPDSRVSTMAIGWTRQIHKFDCSCATDAFTVKVLGGRENQAVVVFVFETALMTDPRLDNGVFADVTTYPL